MIADGADGECAGSGDDHTVSLRCHAVDNRWRWDNDWLPVVAARYVSAMGHGRVARGSVVTEFTSKGAGETCGL